MKSASRERSSRLAVLVGICLVFAVLLAGCAKAEEPTPVLAVPPTRTPKPTFTAVSESTVAPTLEPSPTFTSLPTATPTETPLPTATRDMRLNPLTGKVQPNESLLKRRVLAVRVGNDPSIRPQEGLGKADIVYEEIMDGWTLTRFTALYLDTDAERIRPIRSARLSSLAIVPQYDAALIHSGASDKIRWLIAQADFVDVDEYFNHEPYGILSGYDWRGRMYTSVGAVRDYLAKKGWEREEAVAPILFDEAAPEGRPAAFAHVPYPKLCVVDWEYAPEEGVYKRFVQTTPHLDDLDDSQISASNVIMLYAEHKKTDIVEDSLGSTAIDIVLDGSGRAQVLRDGVAVDGYWKRFAADRPIAYFLDEAATEPLALNPGQTWIQLVPPDYEVTIE